MYFIIIFYFVFIYLSVLCCKYVVLSYPGSGSIESIKSYRRYKYVDDLTLLECRDQRKDSNIQVAVTSLRDWSLRNQTRLNPQKCISMEVCFMRDAPPPHIAPIVSFSLA